MSDLENELLGLAEEDPRGGKRRRNDRQMQEYGDDSDEEGEEEMDMDLDSESEEEESAPPPKTGPAPAAKKVAKPRAPVASKASASGSSKSGNRNPYPLDGQYVDEDDRDHLENLPEIEREAILAARAEEMQKFKDAQQLDAMFQGIAGAADEDEEDDGPRKKRKHTSVTKEASRAMKDLRNKRKAMDERAARRAARREARQKSPSGSEASEEDGEISHRDSSRDQHSYRYSPEPSSSPQARKASPKKENIDAVPPNSVDLNGARLSRYEMVDMMFKDGFEDVVAGAYVRLMASERDEAGRPKYRIHKIVEVTSNHTYGRYSIEYKDRQVKEDRALMCQYGKAKRLYRIADVSNSDFLETEFLRFTMTNQADGIRAPKKSELQWKHEQIKELRERPMTDEEISRQVENRKSGNLANQRSRLTIEIGNLMASRNAAMQQGDEGVVRSLEQQILQLGGDPETGELIGAGNGETHDERMLRISENSKKRAKEHMAAAHIASIQQRRAQEAVLKAKQAELNAAAVKPAEPVAPVVPPIKAMRKNETPQQFVARTVELDLGDF